MRIIQTICSSLLLLFLAVSCIQEEAPNAEADILTCTLQEADLLNREPIVENDKILFIVKGSADITALTPVFTLTPGATISPASGTTLDFSQPQYYTVTSEDQKWQKKYKVEIRSSLLTTNTFAFENVRKNYNGEKAYQIFYEADINGNETMVWGSGNAGFALTGSAQSYNSYPTYQSPDGRTGNCAVLTTCKTGSFGSQANMPIAAGNLFIGTFNVVTALSKPLESTKFGVPFYNIPTTITGYYKYRAGDVFYELDKSLPDKLKEIPGKKDSFNIYAVFFESTEQMPQLDGTNATAEDNPNIISVAKINNADAVESDTWKEFSIPFVPRAGKEVDMEKLAAGKYSVTIVFSSSLNGDTFEGAPGSTLYIDDVELKCESSTLMKF